jgi:2-polyprenyl-3-methyl-5-hydroxy-6-metoxy-1,4-benzoquinol methylase
MQTRSQQVKYYFNETDNYLKNKFLIAIRSRLIKKNLPDLKNKSILDIGCGNGDLTLPYIIDNKITFIDLSDKMLEIVRSNIPVEYYHHAKLLNIDIDKFDLKETYDYVFMIGVLAHINSPEITFSRLAGLLDSDGTLIIQFTNSTNIISFLTRLISKIKNIFGESLGYKMNYTSLQKITKELGKNRLEYYNKVTYWPELSGSRFLSEGIRKFIYYKLLNSRPFRPLGSEILLFISLVKDK